MERSYAGPYPLSDHVRSCIQRPVPGAVCVGNARSSDRGWRCCLYRACLGAGAGIVYVCDGYSEGILPREKGGVLKMVSIAG